MSTTTNGRPGASVWNVPNQITLARLILALVFFGLVPLGLYMPALIVFAVAAGTDWLDGYWARKYDQVTQLGRILDPFADKIIICGAFIFLVAEPDSGITSWLTVIVVGREMLVTTIRSFLEQQGADFSAQFIGKLKMVLQCAAVVLSILSLRYVVNGHPSWLVNIRDVCIWSAIICTVYSGVAYIFRAASMVRG